MVVINDYDIVLVEKGLVGGTYFAHTIQNKEEKRRILQKKSCYETK